MAKKLRFNYTFVPSSNTIILNGYLSAKRLLLITNSNSNIIIYNFSDPSRTYTSLTYNNVTDQTSIVLSYNCSGMSSTDNLQIFTEEDSVAISPSEVLQDPVNKFRTSQPQALIDTDFEYGTQISKWENLALTNNRPFAYVNPAGIGTINYVNFPTGGRAVSIGLVANTFGISAGTPIVVNDTFLNIANGTFLVDSVSGAGSTVINYTAKAANTTTLVSIADTNKTGIFSGTTYASAAIGTAPTFAVNGVGYAVTVTTTVPHGLSLGNEIAITGITGTNPPNGSFVVSQISSPSTFTYFATGGVPASLTATNASLYVRPQGQVLHRPFDGGVIFTSNGSSNFENVIRQTRRYFRYQSGKGIQMSSGTILKPNFQLDSLTSSGTTVTVTTKEQHNIQPGTQITVTGANETAYNGTFTVASITGYNTFTYTAGSTPSATTASGNYSVSVTGWYGAANRLGIFDHQNGLFFEFDGQTLYAVRRNSTYQIAGKVTATQGSNTVTQTSTAFPTYFSKQLAIGNFIVIRGQQYRITDIASDTSMTISPSYRGATVTNSVISKTVDTRIPQSQWNLDRMDGTGPSGYNMDLSKMQMFYIDYSWYGAGFVRWGFRAQNGDVVYCHKLPNNNVNTEAYMRSGNLPGRYETITLPPTTQITAPVAATDAYVGVASTAGFPTSGTLCIRSGIAYEYVNYAGIGTTAFTGVTRSKAGGSVVVTGTQGSNVLTSVASTTNIQVGQRVFGSIFADGTFVSSIDSSSQVTLSQSLTSSNAGLAVTFVPMGIGIASAFAYSATAPVAVELAYPTFAPTISHWGTSAIMDGRFDDDKSLVFTYGQSNNTSIPSGASRALFSIRVAPSVDNGIAAAFGARELTNRMQLTLKTLDVSIVGIQTANVLVRAYINGIPSSATPWTNAVNNAAGVVNSSLAQISDYAGGSTTVTGGEVTGGFFVSGTGSIDISNVRDLGNSILGGGGVNANTQVYPDGPDVLTIVATNYTPGTTVLLSARIGWTEAQA